jgi:multiple sugar transport system substrate-binding protein
MKKKVLSLLLTVVMVFTMAGCGSNSTTTSKVTKEENNTEAPADGNSAEVAGTEATTLTLWVRNTYYNACKIASDKYHEKNPNVTIEVVEQAELSDQFALSLTAGTQPDIVSMDCVLVPYYSSIGALTDITDKVNSLEYKDTFSEGMVNLSSYEEKQYAIPFGPDVSILLFNKAHFTEAGLDPEKAPATWDELVEYAQKLQSDDHAGYVYGGSDAGTNMFTFVPYIWNNGGDVMSEDGSKSTLDQPEAIEALQFFCDLTNKYKVTPASVTSYGWGEAQDAFTTGKASMVVLGSAAVWDILTGEYGDIDMGIALIPAKDGKNFASFSGGDCLGITNGCKNADVAWDFIQYCLSEEIQVEEMTKYGMLPARSDLFENQYFAEKPEYSVLQEALKVGRAPYSLKYNEMYAPFLDGMQAALNNEMTAEEAFTSAAENINSILAQ